MGYSGTRWTALMLSAVLHTIARHDLFAPGDRVLVAVSGGPDSMALLAVLWELAPRLGLTLEVATVDHGLRPEAAAERALVAERAQALGLPCHALKVEVVAGRGRGGLQEVARRARLAALETCADARGCAAIALGHQADDQAETVLFRIVRGTGLRGLGGIPYRRGRLVRPLLDISRARVLSYLRRRSLPFAQDPSNLDPRFARARIRHVLLPALRRENPRVDEALRRLAIEAAGHPESEVRPTRVRPSGSGGPRLEASEGGDPACTEVADVARAAGLHLPARLKDAVAEATRKGGTTSFDVAGGRRLTVSYGRATVSRAEARAGGARRPETPGRGVEQEAPDTIVTRPGLHRIGQAALTVVVRQGDLRSNQEGAPRSPEEAGSTSGWAEASPPRAAGARAAPWAWFDLGKVGWPLVLRRPRAGDRMRPRGGRGSRKLSDLFIDAKIPRPDRANHLVVTSSAGEVLYVPGLRPSASAAPTDATVEWLGLAVSR